MSVDKRYWDSSVFLEWLNRQPKRAACESVLRAAEKGETLICTSALTLGEVIKLKGHDPLTRDRRDLINDFFRQDYIHICNLTPHIGRRSQEMIWTHPHLKPKDAMHIATADCRYIPLIETFDKDFLKLDGKIGASPIEIAEPNFPGTEDWVDAQDER